MTDPNPYPTTSYGRNTNTADVLIVGAGLSGMTTAIELLRKGVSKNFIIVDKGNQVGGTWNDQRYPGCCCDVWSHLYSLSFEPNPNWTREYPGQEEILDYLVAVAHKYQLYKYIRFSTAVTSSTWDEAIGKWKTSLQRLGSKDAEFGSEYTVTSDFLVSAVGQLNIPKFPDIPGLEDFKGKTMHSARWDWDFNLTGARIGIIGNGATAAQIIPEIAKVCRNLTVFQRTANWVIPRLDKPISPSMQAVYKYVPLIRRRIRAAMMDFREGFYHAIFDTQSPIHEYLMAQSKEHLATQLEGEEYAELRKSLQPSYAIGCKRVIITDDYFPTFKKDNVRLETGAIERITEKGVKTADGVEHEFDLLVCATGFKTTQFMYPIKIFGKGGKSIENIWADGATAYLGMTVPELPNFSMLYGPNTNLGHNSIILMIEAQALYIQTIISKILEVKSQGGNLRISPKASVTAEYNETLQKRLEKSAFADPTANSWYKNEKGLITNNWAGTVIEYQERTKRLGWEDFEIEGEGKDSVGGEVSWHRVVEETQVSNGLLQIGSLIGAAAVVGGVLWRQGVLKI